MDREILLENFDWRKDGLYWKSKRGRKASIVGKRVGCVATSHGYRMLTFQGKNWLEHRLIFFLKYGYFPHSVDHINGKRDDNRVDNLREATPSQQMYNQPVRKDSKSGIKGVYWWEARQKWRAHLKYDGIWKTLGYFDTKEAAEKVANEGRKEYHKEYAYRG